MNKMKKFISVLMLMTMVLMLSACGGEKVVTYYAKMEEEGIIVEEWMTLHAKGDKVERIGDTLIIDYSTFDAEIQQAMVEAYDEMVSMYQAIEGVECTGEKEEGQYTISFTFETKKEILDALAANNLFEVEEGTEVVSLKATEAQLTSDGYVVTED